MKTILEKCATIPYQIFFLIATSIILVAMLYRPIVEFHPVGKSPGVIPVTQEVIAQWGKEPTQVNTGFSITDFIRFDPIKNDYLVNAIVWFEFDPSKVSLETIEKFSFTKGDVIKKSDATVEKKSDTLHRATYFIRVQFGTIMDYVRFPLDDHRLFLNLTNNAITPEQVVFNVDPSNYSIDKNLYLSGWQLVGHEVRSGYSESIVGNATVKQPKVVFSLDVSKQDLRQLVLIVLPLLLIFFFTIFAFSLKDITLAITLVLASVSGLLAYAFVIQTLSPAVGYFMLSDYLFLFFMGCVFIIFLISILFAVPEHLGSKRTLDTIKGLTIPLLYILLIIVWYYLTNIKDIS